MKIDRKPPFWAPGRWFSAFIAAPLIAGSIVIFYLGHSIVFELDAVSTAKSDNVSWNTSQLEVELLRAHTAAIQARDDHGGTLAEVRTRFDIFYSRIATMRESDLFLALRQDQVSNAILSSAQQRLDRAIPLIDGPDEALRAGLPDLVTQLDVLLPDIRQLSLAGTQLFSAADSVRREEIARTLVELAAALFTLILALIGALAVLLKLFRRGQSYARDMQVARSRFEAAISSSLDAVLVMDTAGRVIDFNGAGEAVFGYTRDEAIGADMAELMVPDHLREHHRAGMKRFLETGEKKLIGKGRVRHEGKRKSGEVFPVEMSISVAKANDEQVFVSFLRDITLELEAEDQLRSARDKAEQSEKAKSNLLTVMSHEMRTPLNGILGSLSLIDRSGLSERNRKHLKSIEVSGELLLSHVNDVLDLSSLMAESMPRKKGYFDLHDLVQKVSTSLQANAEARGNRLTVLFLTEGLGTVQGYKTALQQCLVNLAGNAIKFTKNGLVSIEVERLAGDDLVEIRVADTGVGIAPENLDRIFEEFVTVDTAFSRETAGTGLGLAITRRLAESMGATIEADSFLGEGSIFTIQVPLPEAESPVRPNVTGPGAIPAAIPQGRTALVVDDNEINRMVLTDMVCDLGIEVRQANDGYAAVDALTAGPVDIVLLDISMPGIDGIETLARIRALDVDWHDVPAIAVTAHASAQDHETIMQADFNGLLVKPVDPASVRAAIASALGSGAAAPQAPQAGGRTDFEIRFGREKYDHALRELGAELVQLLDDVQAVADPTGDQRKTAHRLSGSAAVLGRHDIWDGLQQLQNLDVTTMPKEKDRLVAAIHAMLETLPTGLAG